MKDETITIEIDGQPLEARNGQMLIEVADTAGIYIPRFCYHKKLSVAANCRMCLVEAEKVPKPVPACATPVSEGMKVHTRSPKAIAAQKATMEFLLINHPLDCPICDQGGECELQDLAMGYGRDVSRYSEGKRVVRDKDIGPLISTDMTRCIHCTRCVRFGEEITGMRQLGTTQRGENMEIETYIEQSIDHELSANIIDLCPVGALNNKPFRYSARTWELERRALVSPHDCVGSNMYANVMNGIVKRVTPRSNEAINENWLSDRDRFSYQGIYSSDRLPNPRVKEGGVWQDLEWSAALELVADKLKMTDKEQIGILASPSVTVEEAYLLTRLAAHLGTSNIDHRVTRQDFSDQDNDPVYPWLGCEIADIEEKDAIFVIGSNLRREVPILAHRVRKAARSGAKVSFANSREHEYFFDVWASLSGAGLVSMLAGVAVAAADGKTLPEAIVDLCHGIQPGDGHKKIAESLKDSKQGLVLLGNIAGRHRAFSAVRALAAAIAETTGCDLGYLSEGANSAGAHLVGLLPHRLCSGKPRLKPGLQAAELIDQPRELTLLLNLEPDADIQSSDHATKKLANRSFVVALTPYFSEAMQEAADLVLPIGTFAESSGTYVNVAGTWQSFDGAANPVGEARPAWKVLRVLGNLLGVDGFDYMSSKDVLNECVDRLGNVLPDNSWSGSDRVKRPNGSGSPAFEVDIPMYSVDGLLRRADSLQMTPEAKRACNTDS